MKLKKLIKNKKILNKYQNKLNQKISLKKRLKIAKYLEKLELHFEDERIPEILNVDEFYDALKEDINKETPEEVINTLEPLKHKSLNFITFQCSLNQYTDASDEKYLVKSINQLIKIVNKHINKKIKK